MPPRSRRFIIAYIVLVVGPIVGLAGILRWGATLTAPHALEAAPSLVRESPRLPGAPGADVTQLFSLILAVAAIVVACRVTGTLFRLIRQPRVVGEMFAGIFLGPSVLGAMAPEFSAWLFRPSSLGSLNALSQIGMVIFMFLVGMKIDTNELRARGHAAVLTSHVSITFPFLLGTFLALYLYPRLSNDHVSFTSFGLFVGAAMSITAFPVLARILTERRMLESRLGTIAVACAAVDDVTGWSILAYIVLLIRSADAAAPMKLMLGGVIAFAVIMIAGVRPPLRRFEKTFLERGALSESALALILVLVLGAALCTESLGVHALFGAFLMGAIMPKDQRFVQYVVDRFETIVVVLLLPLFFALTGLRTQIGLVSGVGMWVTCGAIVFVAVAGKLGGSALAAWLMGLPLKEAAALGTLMNTRGLMELVVLNIGLDVKVISPALFSMMVLMALITTFMTTPLLDAMGVFSQSTGVDSAVAGKVRQSSAAQAVL